MTRAECIRYACETAALIGYSVRKNMGANDGFCDKCPFADNPMFRNDGAVLRFMRQAVVEKLRRDGHELAWEYDEKTGELT